MGKHLNPRTPVPVAVRLARMTKMNVETGCWKWQGWRDREGYGKISIGAKVEGNRPVHRVAYELAFGPIPDGMLVMHKCDNPPCINPDHLILGTVKDNHVDMLNKDRAGQKLNREQVIAIKAYIARGDNLTRLAEQYSVTRRTITGIKRGDIWSHV